MIKKPVRVDHFDLSDTDFSHLTANISKSPRITCQLVLNTSSVVVAWLVA